MTLAFWRAAALAFVGLVVDVQTAAAWNSPAPDVVLYCTPAMADALRALSLAYTSKTQVEVHVFLAPPDGLFGLIKHRARDDVVVADAATLSELAEQKLIRPETVVMLGNDPYVLVAKAGTKLPPAADAGALVSGRPTVLPDATTAATFDGAAVLHEAVPSAPKLELIGVSDTPSVLVRVRADDSVYGLVHETEAGTPGVVRVARLAAAPTATGGALVTMGQSANAAAFLAFVAGPEGRVALRAAGLEPLS